MFRVERRTRLVAGLVAWLAVRVTGVGAQDTAGTSEAVAPASRLAEAQNHFALGTQLFDAGSFRDALREFELVTTLAPNAEVWFNIGRAYEELAEYPRAVAAFERYLRDSVQAKDAPDVRARIAQLERLAHASNTRDEAGLERGSLRIHARSADALVLLDGQHIEAAALDRPLLLSAGRHRLDVSEDQFIPLHARVDVHAGLLTAAYAELQPITTTRTRTPGHGFSWTLFGLAGLGAFGSGAFAGVAIAQQAGGHVRPAENWAVVTDVALVGTAVCAIAATLVYYLEARTARTERLHAAR